jgi:hypothetical protein
MGKTRVDLFNQQYLKMVSAYNSYYNPVNKIDEKTISKSDIEKYNTSINVGMDFLETELFNGIDVRDKNVIEYANLLYKLSCSVCKNEPKDINFSNFDSINTNEMTNIMSQTLGTMGINNVDKGDLTNILSSVQSILKKNPGMIANLSNLNLNDITKCVEKK